MQNEQKIEISEEQKKRDTEINKIVSDILKVFEDKKCTMLEIPYIIASITDSVTMVNHKAICKALGGVDYIGDILYKTLSDTIKEEKTEK